MVDFCQRLTVAKRKILEEPDLYPEYTRHALPDSDALRLDQKMRRRKVCEKLALVPGKLDHATITAFSVADRTKSLQAYSGKIEIEKKFQFAYILLLWYHFSIKNIFEYALGDKTDATDNLESGIHSFIGGLRAPCASSEDLTFRDDDIENEECTDHENDIGIDEALPVDGKKVDDADATPTPSISLCSTPSPNCASLAATPVHQPKQNIDLCLPQQQN